MKINADRLSRSAGCTLVFLLGFLSIVASGGGGGGGGGGSEATSNGTNPPSGVNSAPIARTGADQTSAVGEFIQLNGTSSSDPDGESLSFFWKQGGGEPAVELSGANSATPTFEIPVGAGNSTLSFELTVTDTRGGLSTAVTQVEVSPIEIQEQIPLKTLTVSLLPELFDAPEFSLGGFGTITPWESQVLSGFSISGLADEAGAISGVARLEVADAPVGQLLFLTGPLNPVNPDPSNRPDPIGSVETDLGPVWITAEEIAAGEVQIGVENFVNALVLMQPEISAIRNQQNEAGLIALAKTFPEYDQLWSLVRQLLNSDEITLLTNGSPGFLRRDRVSVRSIEIQNLMTSQTAPIGLPPVPLDDFYRDMLDPARGIPSPAPALHPYDALMLAHIIAESVLPLVREPDLTPFVASASVFSQKSSNSVAGSESSAPLFPGSLIDLGANKGPRVIQRANDPFDETFLIGNGTFVLYGYSIDGRFKGLIGARDAVFANDAETPPWTRTHSTLGDGEHEFFFTRGVVSLDTPLDRLAASANLLKASCRLLDIVFYCPLSSDTIARGVRSGPFLENLWRDIKDSSPQVIVATLALALDGNWDEIAGPLIKMGARAQPTYRSVFGIGRFVGAISDAVGAVSFFNQATPFIFDLRNAVPQYTTCVSEEANFFSESDPQNCGENKTPEAVIKVDPVPELDSEFFYSPGTQVTYNAFDSVDVEDTFEELGFSWRATIDRGDGFGQVEVISIGFDDPDSGPELFVLHSSEGSAQITLSVRDTAGLIGETTLSIEIKNADDPPVPDDGIPPPDSGSGDGNNTGTCPIYILGLPCETKSVQCLQENSQGNCVTWDRLGCEADPGFQFNRGPYDSVRGYYAPICFRIIFP